METLKAINLGLAFVLELCALVALGYWGFQTGGSPFTKILLGLGAPVLAAGVWGLLVAPKAAIKVSEAVRLGIMFLVFALAVAALFAAGKPVIGWIFGFAVMLNRLLVYLWKQ